MVIRSNIYLFLNETFFKNFRCFTVVQWLNYTIVDQELNLCKFEIFCIVVSTHVVNSTKPVNLYPNLGKGELFNRGDA